MACSKITVEQVEANRAQNIQVTEERRQETLKLMSPELLGSLTPEEYQEFKDYRPQFLEQLLKLESLKFAKDLHKPLKQVLEHSLQFDGGSGNMLFLSLFKHYAGKWTKDRMKLVYYFAWSQSAMFNLYLTLDDIMDKAVVRRYKPTLHLEVGEETTTMLILLAFNALYEGLTHEFKDEPFRDELLRRWTYYCTLATSGQALEAWGSNKQDKIWSANFRDDHNVRRASPVHDLPVEAAAIMSGYKLNPASLDYWRSMTATVNKYMCNTNDFNDAFPEAPTGKLLYVDIVNGTPTWCSRKAWELANVEQKKVLENNYGVDKKEAIANVLQVYMDVNLKKEYATCRKTFIKEIFPVAAKCPEDLVPRTLFQDLFNGVMQKHGLAWN